MGVVGKLETVNERKASPAMKRNQVQLAAILKAERPAHVAAPPELCMVLTADGDYQVWIRDSRGNPISHLGKGNLFA